MKAQEVLVGEAHFWNRNNCDGLPMKVLRVFAANEVASAIGDDGNDVIHQLSEESSDIQEIRRIGRGL